MSLFQNFFFLIKISRLEKETRGFETALPAVLINELMIL